MRSVRFFRALLPTLTIALAVGCTGTAPPQSLSSVGTPSPASIPASPSNDGTPDVALPDRRGMAPEDVVEAFYTWYIGYYPGNPRVDGSLAAGGYLTDEHLQRIDDAHASFVGGGADPLLCAQDVPTSVAVQPAMVDGERAALLMNTSFAGQTLEVHLRRVDGQWQIDRVHCAPQELAPEPTASPAPASPQISVAELGWTVHAAQTADWPEYRNEAFGLAFRYPLEWVYRELTASPDSPPIGPENVRLVIHVMPQAWAVHAPDPTGPEVTPFLVEVSEGTLEQFRLTNMEPARSARYQLLGCPITWEEEALTDDLSLQRFIFQHPGNGDLRVTLHDPISGFPERLAARASAVGLFRGVVASFRFLD